jgi:hypothetical protein
LERAVDIVLGRDVGVDDVLLARYRKSRGLNIHDERAKSKADPSGDRPVFKEHKPSAVRENANTAQGPSICIDFHLEPDAVGAIYCRDRIPAWSADIADVAAIESEVRRLIVLYKDLIVGLNDRPVSWLGDNGLPVPVDGLLPLAADRTKTLVLQPEPLID